MTAQGEAPQPACVPPGGRAGERGGPFRAVPCFFLPKIRMFGRLPDALCAGYVRCLHHFCRNFIVSDFRIRPQLSEANWMLVFASFHNVYGHITSEPMMRF